MADPLELWVEETPNPNARKFTLNRTLAERGLTYRDRTQAPAGWAQELLGVEGVTQVFALHNFVSVTKRSEVQWDGLVPQVEQILRQAFA